ncbi:PEP-CTERM sorting domain-containing protein [Roseateles sp.]|uniref:PEP-CTERM sorting domain-containing protein n=1 Tax=Roseateles sp. TaxID=1971397 RepID=UPI003263B532
MKHVTRITRCAALAAALCGASLTHAAPVLIDFSNYAATGVHATVSSGNFTFTPAGGTIAVSANGANCAPTCAANGTTALAVGAPGLNPPSIAPVTMTTAIYSSFRLTGLDYAELSNNFVNNWSASSILLEGTLLGGGTVSQMLAIDGVNDGPGGDLDFEAAALSAIWDSSELVSLQFTGFIGASANHAFQLDSIALDVTREGVLPEPGSLALAGLALAGLAVATAKRVRLRRI